MIIMGMVIVYIMIIMWTVKIITLMQDLKYKSCSIYNETVLITFIVLYKV